MQIQTTSIVLALLTGTAHLAFCGQHAVTQKLIGCWHLIASQGQDAVEMEFKANGELIYAIRSHNRWSIMKLTYKVDGDSIVTNQASHPKEERTRYSFEKGGVLLLNFNGEVSRYQRGPKRAPTA